MKYHPTVVVFLVTLGLFLFLLGSFFLPPVQNLLQGRLFLVLLVSFGLSGLLLLILAWRGKEKGLLRKFLLLTGASATGFFAFSVLHNLFYALAIVTNRITILHILMESLHVDCFLVSIFVCPVGFLVGLVGSIVVFVKK